MTANVWSTTRGDGVTLYHARVSGKRKDGTRYYLAWQAQDADKARRWMVHAQEFAQGALEGL